MLLLRSGQEVKLLIKTKANMKKTKKRSLKNKIIWEIKEFWTYEKPLLFIFTLFIIAS